MPLDVVDRLFQELPEALGVVDHLKRT